MDYFYIGKDICRFESKKPCWIIRQFQKLIDLHWVSTPDPRIPTDEELREWKEHLQESKRKSLEREEEMLRNWKEDRRNYCEKYGVNVDEYPSLTDAWVEAFKIERKLKEK